ncbi:hypothetical protein G7066_00990 [Leucobacter coleopterorum]|uniref:Uncharacterized protein n=1 Tax=Leucobacter coleopterorum TaxID=2714933 RepID=A0ABX6JXY3_9MICO|nr:hypothetical protein [Leucobacter coleopterorum]QIM17640.1 hypothetical protein G7066_00990 [Leucobacter coleopterorum]
MDATFLTSIPWYAWIAIMGVVVFGITTIVGLSIGRNTELSKALAQNAEINQKLVDRLDSMDTRLASLESTLNDIPN